MDWLARLSGLDALAAAVQLDPLPAPRWGKITIPRLGGSDLPEDHERSTMYHLAALGIDLTYRAPAHDRRGRFADLIMDGQLWDMKSPEGAGRNNINNTYKSAHGQARRIVIDLARTPLDELE